MVRITGSVQDEKSVNAPTDDSLSSVGRRRRGNRAKRMSGTDSRAPTQNPPTASNAPRKERLLGDNSESESFAVRFPEHSASSTMPSPSASGDHGCPFYFCLGSSRRYATNFFTSSGLILAPKAGIFPLPLVITSLSAS